MKENLVLELDQYIKNRRYPLINSVLLYKDNELILERYYNKFTKDSTHNIKSIWKSILSICIGICLDHGWIKCLEEPIGTYIPEFLMNRHPFHSMITIQHLLTMSSGIYWNGGVHYHCPMYEQLLRSKNWIEFLSDIKMADLPGTRYVYKEWDVILLSAIIQKATGMDTFDFCNQYLYQPLQINSGRWWRSNCGIAYSIGKNEEEQKTSNLSANDLAKIGFLFLNKGCYNNQQIISKEYIKEALTPSQMNHGYGYLWWLFDYINMGKGYGCRGYGGQEINVIPEKDIIYVIQAKATSSCKSYPDVFHMLLDLI